MYIDKNNSVGYPQYGSATGIISFQVLYAAKLSSSQPGFQYGGTSGYSFFLMPFTLDKTKSWTVTINNTKVKLDSSLIYNFSGLEGYNIETE